MAIYLPAGLGMSVVAEVLGDPAVDGGQGDFGLLAGLHGHADERGVGVWRFHMRVGFIIDLFMRLSSAVPIQRRVGARCSQLAA